MTQTQVLAINQTQVLAIGENAAEIVTVESQNINVITVGAQGAAGHGIPAGGTTGQALVKSSNANYAVEWADSVASNAARLQQIQTLGETTSAYRIVYADIDGKVYVASSDDTVTAQSVRGITTQAGDADDTVNVLFAGEVTNGSWNWSSNQNLYLGASGAVTNIAPTAGVSLRVGYAVSADTMCVDIGELIIL